MLNFFFHNIIAHVFTTTQESPTDPLNILISSFTQKIKEKKKKKPYIKYWCPTNKSHIACPIIFLQSPSHSFSKSIAKI